jgi:hypothetical protein
MNNLGGEGKLSPPACLNFHLSKTGKYSHAGDNTRSEILKTLSLADRFISRDE